MTNATPISFGDNVRVRSTPDTKAAGIAGLVGDIRGMTTPSEIPVHVIGQISEDVAFNVFSECRGEGFWFSPDLLEFVDHAPGTVIGLKGAAKRWVRTESGEWESFPVEARWVSLLRRVMGMFGKRR